MVKIVVIGAGIAGITAANHLISNGYDNVCVIEATDRLGGRIWTQTYGTGAIEMGAQWIHGEDDNVVFDFAKKHGLISDDKTFKLTHFVSREQKTKLDIDKDECDDYFFTSDGHRIPQGFAEETCFKLDKIFDSGDKYFLTKHKPFASIGEYAETEFEKYLQDLKVNSEDRTSNQIKRGIFSWRLTIERVDNACQSLYDIPIEMWGAYTVCPGKYHTSVKDGFNCIVNKLSNQIPTEKLRMKSPVQYIYWNERDHGHETSDKPAVVVETVSGERIKADHVIVTYSLGILKESAKSMFNPPLPQNKLTAISNLGFGIVDKIYLEFEEPFWKPDCAGIQLVWLPGRDIQDLENRNYDTKIKWWKAISGFDTVEFHPKLLCGWISGKEAKIMEQLSDEDIIVTCHKILENFCKKELPKPVKIIRSMWGSEKFVRGSYSYFTLGTNVEDVNELGKPLPYLEEPRLLFAGEATHDKYFSTTHGAMASGLREANRIIHHYKTLNASSTQCQI